MDADGDDLPEIFFASNGGKLFRVSPTGQEVWQFNLGAAPPARLRSGIWATARCPSSPRRKAEWSIT